MNITHLTVCNNANCPMAEECSLHQRYIEAVKTEPCLPLLNTSLITIGENGCEYLHIPKTVVVARGFRNMYDTVPKKATRNLWMHFPGSTSRRQFYRFLSGEVQILPDTQSEILAFMKEIDADTSIGFDNYEKVTV